LKPLVSLSLPPASYLIPPHLDLITISTQHICIKL
jgi:hypothetical protein